MVAPLARGDSLQYAQLHYEPQGTLVRSRLAFAGLSLFAVFVVGVFGYYLLSEGAWSLEDCAYMVLITVTTVGYEEVVPVADVEGARAFTMALLVLGMGVSFYFLSALTAFIIEGDLREALWRRRMARELNEMDRHYIVCGAGRTGRYVADELVAAGQRIVVIERDSARLERLHKRHGDAVIGVIGDATDDGVLRDAGVDRALGLVSALHLDQDNLYVALSARQLNESLRIISRGNAERAESKLLRAGADAVISPPNIGGRRMAQELLRPNVVGFLDIIAHHTEKNLDIEQIAIEQESPLAGRTLAKSKIREVSSALVLAIIEDEQYTYNPPPDFQLESGMAMVVLGEREQLDRLLRYLDR